MRRRGRRRSNASAARHLQLSLSLLVGACIAGTIGYVVLGLSLADAFYQTMITVTTVGYREVGDDTESLAYQLFTVVLLLGGVGTALYTLGVLLETLVEGRLTDHFTRRRMDRNIAELSGHVVVCGWGRVGRAITEYLAMSEREVVVVDRNPDRLNDSDLLFVEGDATDDGVLLAAGIDRASALVAALDNDAANLYVTLSGRALVPGLFIVARARVESAEPKLAQAGADRVVNPQLIGGARIAAMILQPSVADFLDVVMHDGSLEFRLEEVDVPTDSAVVGLTLREAHLRDRTGALVLAIREPDGKFRTNPPPDTRIEPGDVLIAIGTAEQVTRLRNELEGT